MARRFDQLALVFGVLFLCRARVTVDVAVADTRRHPVKHAVREIVSLAFNAGKELARQIILRKLL